MGLRKDRVDVKRAIEKLILTSIRIKKKERKKAWNSPQIKTIEATHKLGLIRLQTQHIKAEHTHLKYLV
jgi:hypothetical protein